METELKEQIINQIKPSMNCLLSSADLICEEYGRLSELMFAICWGIDYDNSEKKIWNKLGNKFSMPLEEYFEKYMGIQVSFFNKNVNKAIKHIEEALSKHLPIIVGLDAYYCPWNQAYNKSHILHFCMIVSIDYNSNMLFCKDPSISDQACQWDLGLFCKGYSSMRVFKLLHIDYIIDYKKIYHVLILSYKNGAKDIEENYKRCINDFLNIKVVEELFDCLEPGICKIIIKSKELSRNRIGISAMLLSLNDKYIEKDFIPDLYKDFYNMGQEWTKITSLLIKMLITKKVDKRTLQRIVSRLEELMIMEINSYNKIHQFL